MKTSIVLNIKIPEEASTGSKVRKLNEKLFIYYFHNLPPRILFITTVLDSTS